MLSIKNSQPPIIILCIKLVHHFMNTRCFCINLNCKTYLHTHKHLWMKCIFFFFFFSFNFFLASLFQWSSSSLVNIMIMAMLMLMIMLLVMVVMIIKVSNPSSRDFLWKKWCWWNNNNNDDDRKDLSVNKFFFVHILAYFDNLFCLIFLHKVFLHSFCFFTNNLMMRGWLWLFFLFFFDKFSLYKQGANWYHPWNVDVIIIQMMMTKQSVAFRNWWKKYIDASFLHFFSSNISSY